MKLDGRSLAITRTETAKLLRTALRTLDRTVAQADLKTRTYG